MPGDDGGGVGKRISGEEWEQMETEFQEKNEMEMSDEYQGMIKNIFSQYDIRFVSPIRRSRLSPSIQAPPFHISSIQHNFSAECKNISFVQSGFVSNEK